MSANSSTGSDCPVPASATEWLRRCDLLRHERSWPRLRLTTGDDWVSVSTTIEHQAAAQAPTIEEACAKFCALVEKLYPLTTETK